MKLHLDGVAAAALVAAGVAMADPAAAEPQVGLVALLDYQGAIGTRTSGEARELRYQAAVYADERVETDATGATRLLFLDDTSLSVGARSAVILDKFIYDPASRRGDVAIDFLRGSFRFITGNITNKEAVALRTPTAGLSIRGTDLVIHVFDDGASSIEVREGAVDVQICRVGEPIRLDVGQSLTVSASCTAMRALRPGERPAPRGPSGGQSDTPPGGPPNEPPAGGTPPDGPGNPDPTPDETALVGLGVGGLGISRNLGGLVSLADDPSSNGRLAGIGLASGDDSGNGGVAGASLLSGAASGNGRLAGLAIGSGAGSGQGDLLGASLFGADGLTLSLADSELVSVASLTMLDDLRSVLVAPLTEGLTTTAGPLGRSTEAAGSSKAASAGSVADKSPSTAGTSDDGASQAADGSDPAGDGAEGNDGGLVGAVGGTVEAVGHTAGGLLGGVGNAVGGLGKALGGR